MKIRVKLRFSRKKIQYFLSVPITPIVIHLQDLHEAPTMSKKFNQATQGHWLNGCSLCRLSKQIEFTFVLIHHPVIDAIFPSFSIYTCHITGGRFQGCPCNFYFMLPKFWKVLTSH